MEAGRPCVPGVRDELVGIIARREAGAAAVARNARTTRDDEEMTVADSIMAVQSPDVGAFSTGCWTTGARTSTRHLCGSSSVAALAPRKLFRLLTQMELMDCVLSREGCPSDGGSRHNRKVGIRAGAPAERIGYAPQRKEVSAPATVRPAVPRRVKGFSVG